VSLSTYVCHYTAGSENIPVPHLLHLHQRVYGFGHEIKSGKVLALLLHAADVSSVSVEALLQEVMISLLQIVFFIYNLIAARRRAFIEPACM
jgi:hypothetical protein